MIQVCVMVAKVYEVVKIDIFAHMTYLSMSEGCVRKHSPLTPCS